MELMFNHAVKYKGKFYPPNTPIEDAPEAPQKYVGPQTADEEARLNAENQPQDAPEAQDGESAAEIEKPVKKAAKSRKKDDA